ncbi:MAG: hypothetical protein KBT36_01435 [Kurthia sp.]|nr:hypothetical protein [Candidatus Kurthia equi]
MDEWNNYETLEHHEGMIWVSKLFKTENRGNICMLKNGHFHVLAYIAPAQLKTKDLNTVVMETLNAAGIRNMEYITCSICGKDFDEADVNIVDYPDDVCISCEKNY